MIPRQLQKELLQCLKKFPSVAILGARQTGKTTLARTISKKFKKEVLFLDLEKSSDYRRLEQDAEAYLLRNDEKLVVIDEVQRMPAIFPLLRALIDMKRIPGRFLLLGSSSLHLVRGVSESLAGRIAYIDLYGINLPEAHSSGITMDELWMKGGFPVPLLEKKEKNSYQWYEAFTRSYIEKDMNELFGGIEFQPKIIGRFWQMIAYNSSNLWNTENYARSLGISVPTVNKYLNYMEGAFLITRLYPWKININKRMVKSPKVYITDTGVLHFLNTIRNKDMLWGSTLAGASWEGFVIEQIRQQKGELGMYFYRTHQGAEADIVLTKSSVPVSCIEIKLSTAPQVSRGFYEVVNDLKTKHNYIIMPEGEAFPLKNDLWCYNLSEFIKSVLPLIKS